MYSEEGKAAAQAVFSTGAPSRSDVMNVKSGLVLFGILLALGGSAPKGVFSAPPAFADETELVFYDSIETGPRGEPVLIGGVYRDPEQGARLRTKSLETMPADGYYHIRFVADAPAMARAREFTELLLTHDAFATVKDRFRIEYIAGDAALMNCRNDLPQSPRIIRCNMDYILSLGTSPTHMTAVFTSRGSGGAGGAVTIASIDYPLPAMLHEMLHTWGLQDEYIYSQSEADFYCGYGKILKAPNTSAFAVMETYGSDAEAGNRHREDIPWFDYIRAPITALDENAPAAAGVARLQLGTPKAPGFMGPGLYQGSNCSRKLPSFRPYGFDTIMKTLSTTRIPPIHQKAVLKAIAKAAGW